MFPRRNPWIFLLLAAMFVAALAIHPVQVSAAQTTDEPVSNSCLTCHEDLYYLHDTGKWYCITEHKDRCINCHEGDLTTLNKEESHRGLIAHPQRNNGEKCLECHPQDFQARLTKFDSIGGYKPAAEVAPYTPSETISAGPPTISEPNQALEKLPWAVGGVVFFGLWLMLVLFSPQKP